MESRSCASSCFPWKGGILGWVGFTLVVLGLLALSTPQALAGGKAAKYRRTSSDRLYTLIERGDVEEFKKVLDKTPKAIEEEGEDLIENAALAWQWEILQYLCEKGAKLEIAPAGDESLLWDVCGGRIDDFMVISTSKKGSKLKKSEKHDKTRLLDSVETVKFLVSKGFSLKESHEGETLLDVAAAAGNVELVRYFIEQKLPVDAGAVRILDSLLDEELNSLEIVEQLLKAGAKTVVLDPRTNEVKWSIMHEAIGHEGWLEVLIKNGVALDTMYDGIQPLHKAVLQKEEKDVRLLVEKGASLDARTDRGWTPVLLAMLDDLEMVKYLESKGADLSAITDNDCDALFIAAAFGKADIVEYLMSKNFDTKRVNINGESLAFAAAMGDNEELFKKVYALNPDPKQKDIWGQTLLFAAVYSGNVKIAEFLLEAGVPVNEFRQDGQTAMNVARENGKDEMIEFLRKHGGKETLNPIDSKESGLGSNPEVRRAYSFGGGNFM